MDATIEELRREIALLDKEILEVDYETANLRSRCDQKATEIAEMQKIADENAHIIAEINEIKQSINSERNELLGVVEVTSISILCDLLY